MEKRKERVAVYYIITGIYVLFVGSLLLMSVFWHCRTNIYDYEHAKSIDRHSPHLYVAAVVFCIGALIGLFALLRRVFSHKEEMWVRVSRVIFWGCGAVLAAACLCWIFFYESVPISDQRQVLAEARRIAGFLDEPYNTTYFSYFQRNRGITLLVAAVVSLFGDHLYAFRVINLIVVLVIYGSVCKVTELIFRNPIISSLTSVLLLLFYPLVIYTSYLYGTLLSIAFTSVGMCAAILFCDTGRRGYCALMICSFPLGILAHQSAAIGLLAALIYLMLRGGKKEILRNVIVSVIAVAAVGLSTRLINTAYDKITGTVPENEAVPATCTIYMGLTSTEGAAGPGSQDGSYTDLFNENKRDAAAANRDALRRIGQVVLEYMTGERSLSFFVQKMQYQWLDPTFGARKTIVPNDPNMGDPPNSEEFNAFYDSPLRSVAFKLSTVFMILVYFGALLAGIRMFRDINICQRGILIELYVIGGGAFQMIWESLSRYCLGYFIWLIPCAAYGIYLCCYVRRRENLTDGGHQEII